MAAAPQHDAHAILTLVVYVVVMVLILVPLTVPLPHTISRFIRRTLSALRLTSPASVNNPEKLKLKLDLVWAPLAGVLLLLAATSIGATELRVGLAGKPEGGAKPYDVLLLFIVLAYIATSLDATGALRALAFWVSQRSSSSSKKKPSGEQTANGNVLFTLLSLMWFVAGAIFGNDPIVLSGTAFLSYFTRVTGIVPPTAWIFSEFIGANIASAILVSSNPTNILIAAAFSLNFLTDYTLHTLLPSIITYIVIHPILHLLFTYLPQTNARYIPREIHPPDVNPSSALLAPTQAILQTSLMIATLIALVGSSFKEGMHVWYILVPAGVLAMILDLAQDMPLQVAWMKQKKREPVVAVEGENEGGGSLPMRRMGKEGQDTPPESESGAPTSEGGSTASLRSKRVDLSYLTKKFSMRYPTFSTTFERLPFSLLPFAAGIFILSHALTAKGWNSIFAGFLAREVCTTAAKTVFFVGFWTALVMCPLLGTNIGATILFVEILNDPSFRESVAVQRDPRILTGAIYSLAMASNVGAFSWTFSSSLAGLLWIRILGQKGIQVPWLQWVGINSIAVTVAVAVSSGIVLAQLNWF